VAAKKKKKGINWKRFRSRLYLAALLAGICFYFYDYKSWFALKGYKIEAQSNKIEQRIWEIFPRRCLTFWPYLLQDAKGMKEFLESDMPVSVETHMESFGRFVTKAEWLRAWLKVNWRGKLWSISHDGKMWLYEQGSKDDEEVIGPVWRVPEKNNSQEANFSGVFKSPLPVETMLNFLREFDNFQWFQKATEISWESRAGMNLFILKISNGNQKLELQIQPQKYPDQDVGETVEEIFEKLISEGGSHIIDATYEGKILLRGL